MENKASKNPHVDALISIIEEREKQLKLADGEARREYYQLLFTISLFHLNKGLRHNAFGGRRRKHGSLKAAVHDLFYMDLLPLHDENSLSPRNNDHNFAALAVYAAGQVVKEYL